MYNIIIPNQKLYQFKQQIFDKSSKLLHSKFLLSTAATAQAAIIYKFSQATSTVTSPIALVRFAPKFAIKIDPSTDAGDVYSKYSNGGRYNLCNQYQSK